MHSLLSKKLPEDRELPKIYVYIDNLIFSLYLLIFGYIISGNTSHRNIINVHS